jgi:transposase
MSLPRAGLHPISEEPARVAHATFPDGNGYLRLRDELGTLVDDELFTAVYTLSRGATGAPSLASRPGQRHGRSGKP